MSIHPVFIGSAAQVLGVSMPSAKEKLMGPFQIAAAALLWATDAPFRFPLTQKLGSAVIVFVESFIGLFLSLPILVRQYPVLFTLSRRHWTALLFISLGAGTLASLFFTYAFTLANPTVIILLQKVQPFIAILLAALVLKERIATQTHFWLLALVAIVGVYFVSFGDPNYGEQLVHIFQPNTYLAPFQHLTATNTLAIALALASAFLWGGATVMGRIMLEKVSYAAMTAFRYLFASFFLLLILLANGEWISLLPGLMETVSVASVLQIPAFAAFLYMGLISGFLALFIYYLGLRVTPASVATLGELIFPVSAAAVNWLFLGFVLSLTQIIGTALLLLSLVLLGRENAKE